MIHQTAASPYATYLWSLTETEGVLIQVKYHAPDVEWSQWEPDFVSVCWVRENGTKRDLSLVEQLVWQAAAAIAWRESKGFQKEVREACAAHKPLRENWVALERHRASGPGPCRLDVNTGGVV
jgi:hypothetical protein